VSESVDRRVVDTGSDQLLCHVEDRVAVVTLNRPDARNALTVEMKEALLRSLPELGDDPAVGCVLLTGAGPGFCAGGDTKVMAEGPPAEVEPRVRFLKREHRIVSLLHRIPKPTIAALPGAAAGAGFGLALACDLRILAESAFVTTAYLRLGLSGDYGTSWFLTHLVGTAKAREMFFTAQRVDAATCERIGLANRVVPDADLAKQARVLAAEIANGPPIREAQTEFPGPLSPSASVGGTSTSAIIRSVRPRGSTPSSGTRFRAYHAAAKAAQISAASRVRTAASMMCLSNRITRRDSKIRAALPGPGRRRGTRGRSAMLHGPSRAAAAGGCHNRGSDGGGVLLSRVGLEGVAERVGELGEAGELRAAEPLPDGGDGRFASGPQVLLEAAPGRRQAVDAPSPVLRAYLDRDEARLEQAPQRAGHGGGCAVTAAGEQGRHEVLVGDLLEDPPLSVGEPRLACELAPPLEKELREPLKCGDGRVDRARGSSGVARGLHDY
jgi:enoyl-CoA hydratase/carnithine racemase